jgi:hypothetical protein
VTTDPSDGSIWHGNNDGDLVESKILPVFDALIHGEENVEFARFRSRKKIAVLQSHQSSVTGRLAMVTW